MGVHTLGRALASSCWQGRAGEQCPDSSGKQDHVCRGVFRARKAAPEREQAKGVYENWGKCRGKANKPSELLSVWTGATAWLAQTLNFCLPEVKLLVPSVTHWPNKDMFSPCNVVTYLCKVHLATQQWLVKGLQRKPRSCLWRRLSVLHCGIRQANQQH